MKLKINYTIFGLTGGVRVLLEIANRLIEKQRNVVKLNIGDYSEVGR